MFEAFGEGFGDVREGGRGGVALVRALAVAVGGVKEFEGDGVEVRDFFFGEDGVCNMGFGGVRGGGAVEVEVERGGGGFGGLRNVVVGVWSHLGMI